MLFDHFRGHFAIFAQKVFIFDRFYKGFRNAFWAFEEPCFRWFYKVFDIAECRVCFIYKRNAFLIILEAFLRFRLKKSSFSTGFIRVSATRFWLLRNPVFVGFIKLCDMAECHVEFIYKRSAF